MIENNDLEYENCKHIPFTITTPYPSEKQIDVYVTTPYPSEKQKDVYVFRGYLISLTWYHKI